MLPLSPSTESSRSIRRAFLSAMPDLPRALCRDEDPERWFGSHVCDQDCDGPLGCIAGKSETGRFKRISEAKAICQMCPEREACAEWAIDTDQDFGVWGGLTERERKIIRKARRSRRGWAK